ncbi:MAG: YebC/PmpR family DNA-binding transcriptional regulator [Planctomycetales bacterium]|nr:YebC/PmpR family DNA-binding transcriptional regulator [Planctomycetales bacterium]
MAGHSKWANIQHRKGRQDAKRGKLWSRLSKAIIVAAQTGGDPTANFRLRKAIDDAKAVSMPKDNIERAIKKGTGELDGGSLEEILYEGYGPGGVAILCEILTDNRNRTAPEIRNLFSKSGGELGKTGCVSYLFERKGLAVVPTEGNSEEQLMELAIEAGADDVKQSDDLFEITCEPESFSNLLDALSAANIEPESSQLMRIPMDTIDLDVDVARKVMKLMEALDDHDDVQSVSANFNIPDEVMAELEESAS